MILYFHRRIAGFPENNPALSLEENFINLLLIN